MSLVPVANINWWNFLGWNVSSCFHTNPPKNNIFWTTACDDPDATGPLPASFCFICLVLLTIFTLLLAGLLCWAVRKYRKEGHRYKKMAMSEQEKLQKLEDYYQKKLRYREEEDSAAQLQRTLSELPMDHPALKLPPVDVLLLVDGSGSIGNVTFEQVKTFLRKFAASIDVAPGRSRIACVIFAVEPYVYFNFNRFHSLASAQGALLKMPLMGGGTRLAKALAFASGMLAREQTMRDFGDEFHLRTIPTPRNERLQVIILVSDGTSDDNFDQQAVILNERLQIKIAAVVTKKFYRERLVPIVRYEDAIFTLAQIEALSNWIWNQQKMWNEKFAMMGEKSFFTSTEELTNTAMDNSAIMEETNARSSPKNRIKKHQND